MSGDDDLSSVNQQQQQQQQQPTPPKSSIRLTSNSPMNQMIAMHNPIQLAAISNYKLAQLTFAAPDSHSMRKTALIKNMLDVLYDDTPPEWLDQMTRWSFFTPESLGDMTQETLEEMFAQYAQTIEAFQPLDIDYEDEDDMDDHEMWLSDHEEVEDPINTSGSSMSEPSIFSQPHATISSDTLRPAPANTTSLPPSPAASLVEKPLPKNPPTTPSVTAHHHVASQPPTPTPTPAPTDDFTAITANARRKSLTPSIRSKNRLSWTSDTGVLPTGSGVVQNMASELMNLFDMEFSVDIKLNTAPKLPELPFPKDDARQSHRYSVDSLMGLIPTFESFTIDDDPYFQAAQTPNRKSRLSQSWTRQMTFPPPPTNPPPFGPRLSSKRRSSSFPPPESVPNPPQRSSSLKYREQRQQTLGVTSGSAEDLKQGGIKSRSSEFLATLANALGSNHNNHNDKSVAQHAIGIDSEPISKKKSIRKLASFVKGNKKRASSTKKDNNNSTSSIVTAITTSPTTITPTASPISAATLTTHNNSSNSLTVPQQQQQHEDQRRSISSTISSSSSWSSTSEIMIVRKASLMRRNQHQQPDPNAKNSNDDGSNSEKRRSYTVARPVVVEAQDLRRARSLGHRYPANRNKRRSSLLMEKTASKQANLQQQGNDSNGLNRSKSAFVKIGSGFKARKRRQERRSKEINRRSTIANKPVLVIDTNLTEQVQEHADNNHNNNGNNTFVKRMATLGRRMRLQRV